MEAILFPGSQEHPYSMLAFALTLLLVGLLLVAFAIQAGVDDDGLWMLASGSFVLGFGVRCLVAAFCIRRRQSP